MADLRAVSVHPKLRGLIYLKLDIPHSGAGGPRSTANEKGRIAPPLPVICLLLGSAGYSPLPKAANCSLPTKPNLLTPDSLMTLSTWLASS